MERTLEERIRAANSVLLVQGEWNALSDFFAPDYVAHVTEGRLSGSRVVETILTSYRRAFAELRVDVEILIEGVDRVAWQRTLRATHVGRFKGFPATHRRIVWRDVVTSRFHDGRIVEDWVITDLAERLLLARKR